MIDRSSFKDSVLVCRSSRVSSYQLSSLLCGIVSSSCHNIAKSFCLAKDLVLAKKVLGFQHKAYRVARKHGTGRDATGTAWKRFQNVLDKVGGKLEYEDISETFRAKISFSNL